MLYLPSEDHRPRTHKQVIGWAKTAELTKKDVYGIKGQSVLANHLNIVSDVPIDYMHAVLEGVTKGLMTYWFDSKYSGRSFNMVNYIKQIDKKLLKVKPPHEFRRSPRSIANSLKFWKASEYRAWLLFTLYPL